MCYQRYLYCRSAPCRNNTALFRALKDSGVRPLAGFGRCCLTCYSFRERPTVPSFLCEGQLLAGGGGGLKPRFCWAMFSTALLIRGGGETQSRTKMASLRIFLAQTDYTRVPQSTQISVQQQYSFVDSEPPRGSGSHSRGTHTL